MAIFTSKLQTHDVYKGIKRWDMDLTLVSTTISILSKFLDLFAIKTGSS